MNILGLSCQYHDSAACLIQDGKIIAAAQEERFSRIKHDARFPKQAIDYCLQEGGLNSDEIDYIIFYEKPFLKFERILFTHFKNWPKGFFNFPKILNSWLGSKLRFKSHLKKELGYQGSVMFAQHHQSHAASAFYTSPFESAAILTVDGVGEWATVTLSIGRGRSIQKISEIHFPHSLGLIYSAFTYYLGFAVNDGEYKLMGLAPYGKAKYGDKIKKMLLEDNPDGSFRIDKKYFPYEIGNKMIADEMWKQLFGMNRRSSREIILQEHKDIAASVQSFLEEKLLQLCNYAHEKTGEENLCMAGGVALNCVANSKILNESQFKNVHVFPAAGDAGGSVGAALLCWHEILKNQRTPHPLDSVSWGPEYKNSEIEEYLKRAQIPYRKHKEKKLLQVVAEAIAQQEIVGWFHGRMEFGPRALGNRSIFADPRKVENWQRVNLKVKFRESFRPFAPILPQEDLQDYFDWDRPSPFMLFTTQSNTNQLPAVTHVDGSARIQTITEDAQPRLHRLLKEFGKLTGVPVLINTSFNTSGMPIVCTPQNAYQCFLMTEMETLVLGDFIIRKKDLRWKKSREDS